MIRMKTNIKPSEVYDLAIAAVAEKYTTNGLRLEADKLSDALAFLCDQRDTALYVEWRDAEEATKAKMEQEEATKAKMEQEEADHAEG